MSGTALVKPIVTDGETGDRAAKCRHRGADHRNPSRSGPATRRSLGRRDGRHSPRAARDADDSSGLSALAPPVATTEKGSGSLPRGQQPLGDSEDPPAAGCSMEDRRFISRLVAGAAALALVGVAWQVVPPYLAPEVPDPVPVVRGGAETALIDTFEARRESVVFITTALDVIDRFTRRAETVQQGTGSGFVWDDRGHVITNWHVLEGADRAFVRLADGTVEPARLVGASPAHDLAVLRVSGLDTAPVPLATGEIEVGQTALAIGNPFGLDWTLTTGIVSALDRELPGEGGRSIRGLIQTDAAINPGNSGGPLLDSAGRIIGVNTAIFSPSGASAGIGFAVPVGTVRRVVPQLIETGRYRPPTAGIDVDARVNAAVNRQGLEGVLVLGIEPGSPAADAELVPARLTEGGRIVPGDIIVSVAGRPVESIGDYLEVLDGYDAGDRVVLGLRRGRDEREVEIALAPGS